jgi:hypothetical protein
MELGSFIRSLKRQSEGFQEEVHQQLARYEGSAKSRVISLRESYARLAGLSLQQDELFKQAMQCIEHGIYRAAVVMAWAAFIDVVEQKLAEDGLVKVKAAKTGWVKFATMEELREHIPEHQLIEAARDVRLLSKGETKTILGLLSKRNECAHPSGYKPDMNESLGYVAELLNRVEKILSKSL